MSPVIPVNPDDYPTEFEPLDESITYKVALRAFDFSPKLDKNGNEYLNGMVEVVEPEIYAGTRLRIIYVAVPQAITPDMTEGQRFQARRSGMTYAQVCKCFNIVSGANGIDTDAALGNTGWVSIENETYQGRKQSRIKEFLFQS
jgi:hypothetical protein